MIYEGVPNFPGNDRIWEIVEKYKVTIFYTAPTAIRTFMKWGTQEPAKHDLSSLRVLGSVGEPINPEAWMWYHEHIGGGRCPIVDTWWQTETGGIMISPLPGAPRPKPGSATFPLPGIGAEVVDDAGKPVGRRRRLPHAHPPVAGDAARHLGRPGALPRDVLEPLRRSLLRRRRRQARRRRLPLAARAGRRRDERQRPPHLDDRGRDRRWSSHPAVAEAAVVGANDATTGQAIIAYVTLRGGHEVDIGELRDHVAKEIGAIAKPKTIYFTPDLPKTRSGKIMRRLLRDVAEGRNLGDTTTLADAAVVNELQRRAAETPAED